jgi:hypothetical protein
MGGDRLGSGDRNVQRVEVKVLNDEIGLGSPALH